MLKLTKIFVALVSIFMMIAFISACVSQTARKSAQESAKKITGGFGYQFGEVLDKSGIIEFSPAAGLNAEGYTVKPKIKNKDIDYCIVEVCKRTKIIYKISGFKVYKSKAEAMKYLNAFRPIIEAKYGKLNKLAEENGFYIESVKYGGYEVGLTTMPVSAAPPKWCFLIVYNSEEHKRKCGSSF